jgi:hypothetical protein
MRAIFATCLFMACLSVAHAQAVQRVDITEVGLYTVHTDKSVEAPGAPSGVSRLVSDITLVESTTTVPARLGSNFGFRYRIIGKGKSVRVKKVTHIPEPGIRNPETGNVSLTSVVFIDRTIGDTNFTSYSLDHDWEIVPGTWTMELWVDDRKLASQSFEVVKE